MMEKLARKERVSGGVKWCLETENVLLRRVADASAAATGLLMLPQLFGYIPQQQAHEKLPKAGSLRRRSGPMSRAGYGVSCTPGDRRQAFYCQNLTSYFDVPNITVPPSRPPLLREPCGDSPESRPGGDFP